VKNLRKIRRLDVVVEAPPSKAHTLRALVIGSLANGATTIHRPLLGQDQLNVITSLRRLGIQVEINGESNSLVVHGNGGNYSPTADELDVGESGVGMNFLSSAACLSEKPIVLTGARRITERPISQVVSGLRQLGCKIDYLQKDGFPPIKVHGGGIKGGLAQIRGGKTSQYFSSITISSPYADSLVTLECLDSMTERPYLDITLQMMADFGVKAENHDFKRICVPNDTKYSPKQMTIEGDYSSASFFFLAAAVCKAKVTVTSLAAGTKQGDRAFLNLLEDMGCKISQTNQGVCVEGTALSAIERDMSNLPDLVPPLAIASAFAKGTSRLENIGHLRHKESDRLAVIAAELNKMGVSASCNESSLTIQGGKDIHGATIDPHNDHRIAMSFAIAGLATGDQAIEQEDCVAKSFPDFWERFSVFYE
jgi:3-phosphoshikimate 1-carboxyvinyltransferase